MPKMAKDELCPLCRNEELTFDHKNASSHRFNFKLYEWQKHRKALVKNRHGIEISGETTTNSRDMINNEFTKNKGEYFVKILEEKMDCMRDGIVFTFTVKNVRAADDMLLMHFDTLHPSPNYTVDCGRILEAGWVARLKPGATHTVTLKCNLNSIGEFRMAVAFTFQDIKNEESTKQFTIAREVLVCVTNNQSPESVQNNVKSPFTGLEWEKNIHYVASEQGSKNDIHLIPLEIKRVIWFGLEPSDYFTRTEIYDLHRIKRYLDIGLNEEDNYIHFFKHLLWLDEAGAEVMIEKYNMEKVEIKLIEQNRDTYLELEVNGLEEKRPSLVKGDEIKIKICDTNTAYCGVIKVVMDKKIWIWKVHQRFMQRIAQAPKKTLLVDVKFVIGRLQYERMHRAVELCSMNNLGLLIPKPTANLHREIPRIERFYNNEISNNEEQKQAVANIVYKSSGQSPFIVYGPPGTGKTIVLVEAIIQITKLYPESKILVCAPANAACDMLVTKLSTHFSKNELIRIHSDTCEWDTVPEKVKEYSNRNGTTTNYRGKDLLKFKIVVTTLVLVGKFSAQFPRTHVFIDEAAQALEPEAIIAVGGILQSNGQLILAGDPKQLGPSTNSKKSMKHGLGRSLLDRLMTTIEQYTPIPENSYYIVKLKLNYRSHPQIIHIPNHLFYESELITVSREALDDPISKIILPVNKSKKVKAQAIEFYGTSGQEKREGCSPSYFNPSEIDVVMRYVEALLYNGTVKVVPDDIGIITPYIRQVHRIKYRLKDKNIEGIEVGTTETYQGREKRIIIISTVRAQTDLLQTDEKYKLGFVSNEKRFNVAITRAKSKLIIVGNPHVLCYGLETWYQLIEYCLKLGSYRGCYFAKRDAATKQKILEKMDAIKLQDENYNNH